MVGLTPANGTKINYTIEEFIRGLMAEFMKVNITWIRNMVSVSIDGLMVSATLVNGATVNNTEKVNSQMPRERVESVFGRTERELNGFQRMPLTLALHFNHLTWELHQP